MNMPLPKAVLLDLDDTLISFDGVSEGVWIRCCTDIVSEHQLGVSPQALWHAVRARKDWYWSDPERHRRGRMDIVTAQRGIVQAAFTALALDAPAAALALADRYSVQRMEAVELFPRTIETLQALLRRNVRLGMVTNGVSREQRGKIRRFDLARYFEFILVEEEMGYGKPDLRVFQLALSKLSLPARDVWMVGDNLAWDVGPPQTLGIQGVWHDWRGAGLPAGSDVLPDRIIRNLSALLE